MGSGWHIALWDDCDYIYSMNCSLSDCKADNVSRGVAAAAATSSARRYSIRMMDRGPARRPGSARAAPRGATNKINRHTIDTAPANHCCLMAEDCPLKDALRGYNCYFVCRWIRLIEVVVVTKPPLLLSIIINTYLLARYSINIPLAKISRYF